MAYNRWLSGGQQYQSNDVLHYGRLGMKWGKNIFGLPDNLFQRFKVGPSMDFKSLQNLLQRGEIDFNTFKQMTNRQNMFNQIVNRGRSTGYRSSSSTTSESPAHETVRRSGEQIRDIGKSIERETTERHAREERSRSIAEDKARQGRQDEFQIQQRQKAEAKKKEDLDRAHANSRRTTKETPKPSETSQPKPQPKPQSQPQSKPQTESQQPSDEDLEKNLYKALGGYLLDQANESEEEKKKREAEEAKKKAEEEKKRKEEEERKKRERTEKEVKILKKISKFLSFGRIVQP